MLKHVVLVARLAELQYGLIIAPIMGVEWISILMGVVKVGNYLNQILNLLKIFFLFEACADGKYPLVNSCQVCTVTTNLCKICSASN